MDNIPADQTQNFSDIDLVAYLVLKQLEIIDAVKDDGGRTSFIFKNSQELEDRVNDYKQDREVTINIRTYARTRKDILFYAKAPNLIKNKEFKPNA